MARPIALVRSAPTAIPALLLLAVFILWATASAGYPPTSWAPGALFATALLALALALVPPALRAVPRAVLVACVALAAFTAWSYASMLWAGSPADAWEGANRTLLYLVVFVLFALWRLRAQVAVLLLGVWTLAVVLLALIELLQVSGSGPHSPLFLDARLLDPAGYPNADAAIWLEALVPAVVLSGLREVHPAARAALAAGAALLLDVALLSQSRGSLYALPVVLIILLVVVPGRVRTLGVLLPIGLAAGFAVPALLRVGDGVSPGHTSAAVHAALLGAGLVGLLVGAAAWLEGRRSPGADLARRLHRAAGGGALAIAIIGVLVGLALAGNPVQRVDDAWHSFKGGYGQHSGPRLVSGLGSNRYDFYRVALNVFAQHPLNGVGADNFAAQYLASGRSSETPRYPHSLELRTLEQSGLVGALLLVLAVAAALVAVAQVLRRGDRLARGVAVGAAGVFVYWFVHGSFDWFWEFAGLGAPAWAMLGLACSLASARAPSTLAAPRAPVAVERRTHAPLVGRALLVGATMACLAAVLFPLLAQLATERGSRVWPRRPGDAYASLRQAADLNPLSAQPYLIAGSIALRFGDLGRAQRFFTQAQARHPRDAYASLELAAIASARGDVSQARKLFAGALRVNPRDRLTRQAATIASQGQRLDIQALNGAILENARGIAG